LALKNIDVVVGSYQTITDSQGYYSFDSISPGYYPLSFYQNNKPLITINNGTQNDIAVSSEQSSAANFSLLPLDQSISIKPMLSFFVNEQSGQHLFDSSGLGNHATTKNTSIVEGRSIASGKARYFNGTSAYASVSDNDSLKPAEEISLSSWVRLASTAEYSRIIDKSIYAGSEKGGYSLMIGGAADNTKNKAVFSLYSSSGQERKCISTTNLPKAGTWFHLAATYNGTTSKIYIDGTEVCNQTFSTEETIKHVTNPLNLGRYTGVSRHHLKGSLDEIRIYAKALTSEEIGILVRGE